MAFKARLTRKCAAFSTHSGNPEVLLIRVGHFLWKEYKQLTRNKNFAGASIYLASCEAVWAAKEAYRVPLRARTENNQEAFRERTRARHRARKARQ